MIRPQRVAALFDAHAASLTLYARQLDGVDAEELVQESFIRLIGLSAEPANPAAWLALTLRRIAIDRKRSWFRRRKRERLAAPVEPFEPSIDAAIDARQAAALLASLPERQREVVVLRIWHGLTIAEIGDVLGIAAATAHADLTGALNSLRKRMETRCTTNT